jgi:hypothetical protein
MNSRSVRLVNYSLIGAPRAGKFLGWGVIPFIAATQNSNRV